MKKKKRKKSYTLYIRMLLGGSLFLLLFAVIVVLTTNHRSRSTFAASGPAPTLIPTYQSIGIYWAPSDGSSSNQATVKYQVQGDSAWKDGLPLWYDSRNVGNNPPEYRGSLLMLQPGTTYNIQLTTASGTTATGSIATWTDVPNLPIAQTVTVPSGGSYTITQGGSASGYILYTGPATINSTDDNAVTVSASYVIVRGLTITGGKTNAVYIDNSAHDVIIDGNDISAWGTNCSPPGSCNELDSAVRAADDGTYTHLTVQRNTIHNPTANANNYCEANNIDSDNHPEGPRAVAFPPGAENNVIRYNDISGDADHGYNDTMGENNNGSTDGFPNADSDIYSNIVRDSMDDGIEVDGGARNVRVWGNYIDRTFTGISDATMSVGPLYIFRNVFSHTGKCAREDGGYTSSSEHGPFNKGGNDGRSFGEGERYFFHNTTLQPSTGGANIGLSDYGDSAVINSTTRDNIFNVSGDCYSSGGSNNDFDYDLCSSGATGSHSVNGTPTYASGEGNDNGPDGKYHLASGSPGYQAGTPIPNLDNGCTTVDMGAAQNSCGLPLEFGVTAYETSGSTPTVTGSTGTTPTGTNPTITGSGAGVSFAVTICPHGLGNCGDNVNATGGNTNPSITQKNVALTVTDASNQVMGTGTGTISYVSSAGNFQGTITVPGLSSGQYLVTTKMDGFLGKAVPGILTVTEGQTTTLPVLSVTAGDANNDNQLDILDYNIIIGCYGSKANSASCTDKTAADINDDAVTNGVDYNLFLRELSVQKAS